MGVLIDRGLTHCKRCDSSICARDVEMGVLIDRGLTQISTASGNHEGSRVEMGVLIDRGLTHNDGVVSSLFVFRRNGCPDR